MATITNLMSETITPVLVLNYGYTRGSRNVVLEPLGSGFPTVFLRAAQSKAGTLSLLFDSATTAREAVEFLGDADRFEFEEAGVGEAWSFVVTGAITNTKVEGVTFWVVNAEFREVAP